MLKNFIENKYQIVISFNFVIVFQDNEFSMNIINPRVVDDLST